MIRIEEIPYALRTHIGDDIVYFDDAKKLPTAVYEKYMLLRATDPGTRIEGVGWHMELRSYWIMEDGDDEDDFNVRVKEHGIKLVVAQFIETLWTSRQLYWNEE